MLVSEGMPSARLVRLVPLALATSTALGTLDVAQDPTAAFVATFYAPTLELVLVLHVPVPVNATSTGQLEIQLGSQPTEAIPVTVTTNGVAVTTVCMNADQDSRGGPRCGLTISGTVDLEGQSTQLGELSASWFVRQVARIVAGTPDC